MQPTITSILLRENADNLFENQDTTGIDTDASAALFLDILAEDALALYPDARVTTCVTGAAAPLPEATGPTPRFDVRVTPDLEHNGDDLRTYCKCLDALRSAAEALYEDMQYWLVFTADEA